ncbi:MAG: hypothetical protein ACREJ3_05665 [Polyangiaceae bacterium]
MEWNTPTFAEIKMDAEIGSYQEDYEPERDPIVDDAASVTSVTSVSGALPASAVAAR